MLILEVFIKDNLIFKREVSILTETALEISIQNTPAKLSHFTIVGIKVVFPDYHDPITSRT